MGTRLGAWVIDSLILGGFHVGFWMLAVGVGALSVNPVAEQQMQASPLTLPAIPPYQANLPMLGAMLGVFAALNVAYAAVFWAYFRGMPGQRMLSLQVGSAATGRNLSLGRAFIRAIVVLGIPVGAAAGVLYGVFAFEASVPWSDVLNPVPGGPADVWLTRWSTFLLLGLFLVFVWPVILLVATGLSRTRQGLHDRAAGSLVVGRTRGQSWAAGYPSSYRPGSGEPVGGPAPGFGQPPGYWPPPVPGVQPQDMPTGTPASTEVADGLSNPTSVEHDTNDTETETPAEPPRPPELPPATQSGPQAPNAAGHDARRPGWWTNPFGNAKGGPSSPQDGPVWLRTEDSEGAPTIRSAKIGRRLLAYFFDCVLVYMLFSLTSSAITVALLPSAVTNADDKTLILLGLVGGLEQLAYFVSGWVVWQGTLGQRLMHIQTTQAMGGKAIGWMDGLVRWAVLQGPFALMTIVPSGLRIIVLMAATSWSLYLLYTTVTDPDLRGLHDRFLNSRVVDDIW
ncbi:MAG: RDD family protein [Candidatus Limnocylindrales bacterium]|jgi:hypothetical protein